MAKQEKQLIVNICSMGCLKWVKLLSVIVGCYVIMACDDNSGTSPSSPSLTPTYYCSINNVTYHTESDYQRYCVIIYTSSAFIPSSSSMYMPKSSSSLAKLSSSSAKVYTKTCGSFTYTTTDKTCYERATCTRNTLYNDGSCGSLVAESSKPIYCKNEYNWDVHIAGCTNAWTKK